MPKSVGCFVVLFSVTYSTVAMISSMLAPIVGDIRHQSDSHYLRHHHIHHSTENHLWQDHVDERQFYDHHATALQSLSITTLEWQIIRDDFDIFQLPTANPSTNNQTFDLVQSDNLCTLARAYETYRGSPVAQARPHVAWWRQQQLPPKSPLQKEDDDTQNEDPIAAWREDGCSLEYLQDYLDHPETIAVMIDHNTTAVQVLNTSKLQPMSPITVIGSQDLILEKKLPHQNMPDSNLLLVLGDHADETRVEAIQEYLTLSFIPPDDNKDDDKKKQSKSKPPPQDNNNNMIRTIFPDPQNPTATLLDPLEQTQFVIVPINKKLRQKQRRNYVLEEWIATALALGVIPILEENSWYRQVLSDLPIVWVDSYLHLTPELLQLEWEGIIVLHGVHGHEYQYHYEPLTQSYWLEQALENVGAQGWVVNTNKMTPDGDDNSPSVNTKRKKKRKRGKKKKSTQEEGDQ
ncbi:expressed unknown protein [Seminavis robusta]|uniref:Uncharacterized protein n=1 Tax=Seminavis robusta TaxID=568900 RepID=A0A9N8HVC5_9STRA|nr:expressed unknown protein [Seminavis robusta]|eukprot:Sro1488_g276870.1 n/a (461) ;mRNA; f:8418-9800